MKAMQVCMEVMPEFAVYVGECIEAEAVERGSFGPPQGILAEV
jgi:hypothetical protein